MKTHFTLPANSASRAFSASRLSPKISRLSKMSLSVTRCFAWQDFSGSSSKIRGSSLGRFSLPIQVSSSFCLLLMSASHAKVGFQKGSGATIQLAKDFKPRSQNLSAIPSFRILNILVFIFAPSRLRVTQNHNGPLQTLLALRSKRKLTLRSFIQECGSRPSCWRRPTTIPGWRPMRSA